MLVVNAGMDEATYDEMDRVMYEAMMGHTPLTYKEMLGPGGKLDRFRKIVPENLSRLLALAAQCLGVSCGDVAERERPYFAPGPRTEEAHAQALLQKLDVGECKIPIYVRVDGFELGKNLANAQTHPVAASNARHIVCNDIVEDKDFYLLYMGCTCTTSPFGVPLLSGPQDDLYIYNVGQGPKWYDEARYNAFPHERVQAPGNTPKKHFVTWENPSLINNLNISASYTIDESKLRISTINDYLELEPLVVRVSASDMLGRAVLPDETRLTRFGKIAWVGDYEPL
jgi:hypothetical protein